jgi:predicted GIY-YIG superfamily endonuclease
MIWTVYILKCKNGKHYTGCTSDLKRRLIEHYSGKVKWTSEHLPFHLVTSISFQNKYKAYSFEKYLKSGSGKAFMLKRLV